MAHVREWQGDFTDVDDQGALIGSYETTKDFTRVDEFKCS